MPRPRKYATNSERQAAYRTRRTEMKPDVVKPPKPVPASPGRRRWDAMLRQSLAMLCEAAQEMEDYLYERSEVWQCSERGETFAERLDSIGEIIALLEDLSQS
jgi:hypothetical protein